MKSREGKALATIACLTCSVNFACRFNFGEVGNACKEQKKKAKVILHNPEVIAYFEER